MEEIRLAIQKYLNAEGDGWSLTQFVVAMGLERMDSDGNIESLAWYAAPKDQAEWHTNGLLQNAIDLHEMSDAEDD